MAARQYWRIIGGDHDRTEEKQQYLLMGSQRSLHHATESIVIVGWHERMTD
jgi:hypothetical protein